MKLVFLAEHQWSMHYAIEAYDIRKNWLEERSWNNRRDELPLAILCLKESLAVEIL